MTGTSSRSSGWPPRAASRRCASTRCSMAATRRRARRWASSATWRRRSRSRTPTRGSRRSAAATGRWTATSAGTGSSAGTTRSCTGWGSTRRAPPAAIEAAYARGETDEFVAPTVIDGVDGTVRDHDPIVHVNFRADRARQLTHALADTAFGGFDRTGPDGQAPPRDVLVVTMTEYEAGLPVEVAFGPEEARSLARSVLRGRLDAVPRRRDREVRPRDLLLQRRPGGAVARRGAAARAVAPGRDVRPPAGDERRGRDRRAGRRDRVRPLRLHRRELREPGHGRPHRRVGGDRRRRSRRSTPASAASPTPSSASRPPSRQVPAPSC